jgi:hypothetical protein
MTEIPPATLRLPEYYFRATRQTKLETRVSPRASVAVAMLVIAIGVTLTSLKFADSLGIRVPVGANQGFVLLLCLVLLFLTHSRPRFPRNYGRLALCTASFVAVGFIYSDATLLAYFAGSALTFLFVIAFISGYSIRLDKRRILFGYKLILVLLCTIAALTVGDALFSGTQLREARTLLREPGALGAVLNLGVVLSLSLRTSTAKRCYLYLALILSVLVISSTFKKSIIALCVIWMLAIIGERRYVTRVTYVILLLLATTGGLAVSGAALHANVDNVLTLYSSSPLDKVGRTALYLKAVEIATDRFPFGSGMGTFASPASLLTGYSDTYIAYGLSTVYGLSPKDAQAGVMFIMDAYWAHVIGELGFVGAVLLLFLWFYPAAGVIRRRRTMERSDLRGMSQFTLGACAVVTIESLAHYCAENSAIIIIHSMVVGFTFRYLINEAKRVASERWRTMRGASTVNNDICCTGYSCHT